jgi:hypothetical protein
VGVTAGSERKETVMEDHANRRDGVELILDGELDRLIVRFEGLLEVCKLLEQRGASGAELDEHRRELERVSRQLAALAARNGAYRAPSVAA